MRRGEQTAVPTPGKNQKHYIADALHAHTGRLVRLEQLHEQHRGLALPRSSRLVHGVGIVALGGLMDLIMTEMDYTKSRAVHSVVHRLKRIRKRCSWTEGRWPVLRCEWDVLQNTSQDKRRLEQYLIDEYKKRS